MQSFTTYGSYNLTTPTSRKIPESWEEDVIQMSPLGLRKKGEGEKGGGEGRKMKWVGKRAWTCEELEEDIDYDKNI